MKNSRNSNAGGSLPEGDERGAIRFAVEQRRRLHADQMSDRHQPTPGPGGPGLAPGNSVGDNRGSLRHMRRAAPTIWRVPCAAVLVPVFLASSCVGSTELKVQGPAPVAAFPTADRASPEVETLAPATVSSAAQEVERLEAELVAIVRRAVHMGLGLVRFEASDVDAQTRIRELSARLALDSPPTPWGPQVFVEVLNRRDPELWRWATAAERSDEDLRTRYDMKAVYRSVLARFRHPPFPAEDVVFRGLTEERNFLVERVRLAMPAPPDGWGRPIRFVSTEEGFELRSPGADGVADTADDIVLAYPMR